MKRLVSILLLLIVILSLASCAKCVKIEISEVDVEFVEAYYKAGSTYLIPMKIGNINTTQVRKHPNKYIVIVKYEGKEYIFDDYDFFQKYEYAEQGNKITMNWVTKYYDNDTTKSELKISDSN